MDAYFSKSAVQNINHPIDCRRLDLSLQYCFLDQAAVSRLTQKMLDWIQSVTADAFVFRWREGNKAIPHKQLIHIPNRPIHKERGLRLSFNAYVINPAISNTTEMSQYQKSLPTIYQRYLHHWNIPPFASECSIDFPEFFDALFPEKRLENDEIIENVLKIFHAQNRKYLSFHLAPDFTGHIYAMPHASHAGLYYGSARISFSAFCLDALVDKMADMLAEFACNLSNNFVRLNIQVSLQPQAGSEDSPYMRYFGGALEENSDCSQEQHLSEELYPPCYLHGVEWLNILSPATNRLVRRETQEPVSSAVETGMLPSGAMLVRSRKPITEYDLTDAFTIKRIVLPALYPGRIAFPLRGIYPWKGTSRVYAWCPRNDWAIVPVEESEVEIIGTDLVFCARSAIM